jgi:hypothetical protein
MSNNFTGKTYQTKDILALKEEWKSIAMGAITEDTLPAKRAIRYMVVEMADAIIDPRQDQTPYIQSLVRRGVRYATAHRIAKAAFAIAVEKWQQRDAVTKATAVASPVSAPATPVAASRGGEAKGKIKPAPVQSAKPLNGDARESDGWVWDKDLQDYRDPQTLKSGFQRVRDRHVWDRREGTFIDESTLPDGYKRIEDDWEWNSTMHAYQDPKGGKNPCGLNLIGAGNAGKS